MKKFIKSFSICLIIVAMITTTTSAAAPNDAAAPQSNSYIWKTTVVIVALGNGEVEVDCSITGTGIMEKIGVRKIEFHKEDGTLLESHYYTEPSYEYMMGYDTFKHNVSVRFPCASGERYYAIVYFYASKGNGSGGDCLGSAIITAK